MRRIVDLSLVVSPQPGTRSVLPGRLPAEVEPSGDARPRKDIQELCLVAPYQIGSDPDDTGMDVILGDSIPHTHAESLWINEVTVLDKLPATQRWAVRDMATVPAAEFTCEAAVLDLSSVPEKVITAASLAQHGQHIRQGDFVLLRTGYRSRTHTEHLTPRELVRDPQYLADRPGLTMAAAEWLVRDRQIVGLATDVQGGLSEPSSSSPSTHTYFYMNAVLMIDEMVNFDQLADERVFFSGGLSLRMAGIGSSPARPIALPLDQGDWAGRATNMFLPMNVTEGVLQSKPYPRVEPPEFRGELHKRCDINWLQIIPESEIKSGATPGRAIRPQRDFGSPIRTFSSHLGTHLLFTGEPSSTNLVAPARVLDLTAAGPRHVISLAELKQAASDADLQEGEGAVLHTGYSDRYYHRPDYISWSPGIAPDALEWLALQGTPLMVSDMLTLDRGSESTEARATRNESNLPVVLGASRIWMARKRQVQVICSPIPLAGLDSYPSRVVLVETW